MSQIGGEVADGLRPHPVCTPSYIEKGHAAGGAGRVRPGLESRWTYFRSA